jgi:hypothetical protein
MAEHLNAPEKSIRKYSDPYEMQENIQRALDAFVSLGVELSSKRIATEELATEIKDVVDEKLFAMAENGVDVGQTMLRVSGPSALKLNYKVVTDGESGGLAFRTEIDPENPMRHLDMFEEQLFRARTLTSSKWYDDDAACWRVGVRFRGDDPDNTTTRHILAEDGYPLLISQTQGRMTVLCDESTQIEVDGLARRKERAEALTGLRGRVDGGLIRMLKTIDYEMSHNDSAEFTPLKNIHYLRLLGKYGMAIDDPRNADALNTAIGKVLNRLPGVIVGGRAYEPEHKQSPDIKQYALINGQVADVLSAIPVTTESAVGPSLVMVGHDGKLDDPTYMPLKDIGELKY